jgi:3-oxoacyl-[acyl-carrier-protein] synthase III
MSGFSITGWGMHVPPRTITSHQLGAQFGVDEDWIVGRCGIRERRAVGPGESTASLAIEAGRRALESAGLEGSDIAHLIVASATPEQPSPATSAFVQHALGITGSAHDVNAECAGFIYAVLTAAGLMHLDPRPILVVGSDTHSLTTSPTDRDLGILVGDGSGAIVLEPSTSDWLDSWHLGADGSCTESLKIPAGGSRMPTTEDTVRQGLHYASINGNEIYLYAVRHTVRSIKATLESGKVEPTDVDHFIPHQANLRIIQSILKHTGLPEERLIVNLDRYGNCASASIPIALTEALDAGRIHDGDRVLLAGFGAGMAFGSILLTWGGTPR